ncbi:Ecp49-1 [Fulvia fulva]|uniref:Ecp49-1 n=1 Tax=Passalora fulva TaxID=5499 RepID=A0A1P8YXN2_PASFU|nr:Ecp49-1 [Fulvia fulva]AQA29270.1 extracellular protein 49-1 [Fulvia fulva]KAK4615384.1 Ecp49-1 [Fulvia fulva]KAK4617067.1 Ecp49-1 [Fulvia fulva]UJO16829.1 Ecp49-1 [Fulvia fulva]WPV19383.1 Ecp49-1 [Fulvia fulva]
MQFSIIALLGLSALAVAAPNPIADPEAIEEALVQRNGGYKVCCKKNSYSQCSPCDQGQECPSDKPQEYNSCSKNNQGSLLANLFVCNILNNNQLNIPVTVGILS